MAKRKLLTSGQLADEIGVSPRTIARYASEGALKPRLTTPGGQYRWDLEEVMLQLDELSRQQRDQ